MYNIINSIGSLIFRDTTINNINLNRNKREDVHRIFSAYKGKAFVLFEGGADINPSLYGEVNRHSSFSRYRDEHELMVYECMMEHEFPFLGICRGHQLLNVLYGGTLYQDLSEHKGSHRGQHAISLSKNKNFQILMESCPLNYTSNEIIVNSYHHQGIKKMSDAGFPLAYSSDGLIEAVEYKNGLSVQWHPEFLNHMEFVKYMFDNYVNN